MERTLAHLSDLHLGSGAAAEQGAVRLVEATLEGRHDHVLLTGDITHRGRRSELARFHAIFQPLIESRRLSVIPGNHDRMNDDLAAALMPGPRVQRDDLPGVSIVRVDSTAGHNRQLHKGHGLLGPAELESIAAALEAAPRGSLRIVALHHHPLPLPNEGLDEVLTCFIGLPWCAELRDGRALLDAIEGRCDLVLHGHRHVPSEQRMFSKGARPLTIFNAGRSPKLGRFRVFRHSEGRLIAAPHWQDATGAPAER